MPSGSAENRLPEFFLIKLTRPDEAGKGEVHYIFAEIAASFNAQVPGLSTMLGSLWDDRSGADKRANLTLETTSLPAPSEYTEEWSYFSNKRQSGKKKQSSW